MQDKNNSVLKSLGKSITNPFVPLKRNIQEEFGKIKDQKTKNERQCCEPIRGCV